MCSIRCAKIIRGRLDRSFFALHSGLSERKGNMVRKTCKAKECGNEAKSKGYCPKHYQQVRLHGHLLPERKTLGEECIAPGCGNSPVAKDYCYRHYQQIRRHGRLTPERERGAYGRTSCKIKGCEEGHYAYGYCQRHYYRYRVSVIRAARRTFPDQMEADQRRIMSETG